ncbi:dual specificity protein phosphatase family protein [Haloplanus aerogenes]
MINSFKRSVLAPVADDLYLGNQLAAESRYHDRRFDHVLTVSHAKAPLTTVHRPLQDNERVDQGAFTEAVKTARTLFRPSGSVLIHCAAGISRSPTVVATALTAERHVRSFELAIEMVRDSRPHVSPHPALLQCAEQYLNESIDRNAVQGTSLRVRAIRTVREINRWRSTPQKS